MLSRLPRTASALLLFSSLLATSTAHAAEGKALFDKFLERPEMANAKVEYKDLTEQSSDSFTITDLKVTGKDGKTRTIETLTVEGFKETDNDRVSVKSMVMSGLGGETTKGGTIKMGSISATDAEFPTEFWLTGLTPEMKKQRVTFATLSLSGLDIKEPNGDVSVGTIALSGGDVPLDWRYNPKETYEGDPAAPMLLDVLSISDVMATNPANTIKLNSLAMQNAKVPTSQTAPIDQWSRMFKSLTMSGFGVDVAGAEVLSTENMTVTIEEPKADGTIESKSVVDGMVVDLKAVPDPRTQAVAQQLGYDKVKASMTGDGSYNPSTGRMEANNVNIKLQDMFDLAMTYTLTGYTAEVAQKLSGMNQTMAKGTPPNQTFAAMLPELSKIKLEGLKVALTDRSLTGKLLDMQAAQMGTTGDQLAQGAPMMIGLGMGGLGMPEFTEMVTQAVGKFLQDKGSLTVEAKPAEPVAIMDVVLKGQADPTVVPQMLNLQVTGQ